MSGYTHLPSPATTYVRSPGQADWQGFLLQRSRTTNLAVLLLTAVCGVSLLANFTTWLTGASYAPLSTNSIRATLAPPSSTLTHLIVVPCHSVWIGTDATIAQKDEEWMLEPYQKDGSVEAWIAHIRRAIDEVVADPQALLVFSGGQTRPNVPFPGLSESASYARLAASLPPVGPLAGASKPYEAYWEAGQRLLQTEEARLASGVSDDMRGKAFPRVTTEEYALDSLSNIMFSIARFKEVTSKYPRKISVVGYGFKSHRFLNSHFPSVRWPPSKVTYIGLDGSTTEEGTRREERYGGERDVLEAFARDRYACRQVKVETPGLPTPKEGEEEEGQAPPKQNRIVMYGGLGGKRRYRNPGRRWHPYLVSAPELRGLMEWCPSDGTSLYMGKLPWA